MQSSDPGRTENKIVSKSLFLKISRDIRVSVQGVKSLGGHFAYLCRGFAFIVIIFKKENGNTFTLLIIFIVKSLQKVIQLHGH